MLWKFSVVSQCFSVQLFRWQYFCLSWRFHHNIRRHTKKNKCDVVQDIYHLADAAIEKKDEVAAYRTVELLKTSFGESIFLCNTPGKLMHLCTVALQRRQYATVGHLLEAYKLFIKNAPVGMSKDALGGLILIIHMAKRVHEEYVLGKAADCVFAIAMKVTMADESDSYIQLIAAINSVGLNAVKNGDTPLFKQAIECYLRLPHERLPLEKVSLLWRGWLHQLVKRDHADQLELFCLMVEQILKRHKDYDEVVACLIKESDDLAGLIGVNYKMQCKLNFTGLLLTVARLYPSCMRDVVYSIGRIVKVTIGVHGLKQGFYVLLPVLELGRMYLTTELRFLQASDKEKVQGIVLILTELAFLMEVISRQDGRMSCGDTVMTFREYWLAQYQKEAGRRSVNQFCQLLLKQAIKLRRRNARSLCDDSKAFLAYKWFSDQQSNKLGLA